MTEWTTVLWTDARQLAIDAGLERGLIPEEGQSPRGFFNTLRHSGQNFDAILIVASALARLDAVAWAATCLGRMTKNPAERGDRRRLKDLIQRWLDEPDDDNRRAVFQLAETANDDWPETMLGLAVFFSGGSITPPDLDPVQADPQVCSTLIAGAVQAAAMNQDQDIELYIQQALDLADRVAANGREVLRTA